MKIATYCPNCKRLVLCEIKYDEKTNDIITCYCDSCNSCINLHKIKFKCRLCGEENKTFILDGCQLALSLIHLISDKCCKPKCENKENRKEDIYYPLKCINRINIKNTPNITEDKIIEEVRNEIKEKKIKTIIKNSGEIIKICDKCNAINVIFTFPGKKSYQIFIYNNWFYKLVVEEILHIFTRNFIFMVECIKNDGCLKGLLKWLYDTIYNTIKKMKKVILLFTRNLIFVLVCIKKILECFFNRKILNLHKCNNVIENKMTSLFRQIYDMLIHVLVLIFIILPFILFFISIYYQITVLAIFSFLLVIVLILFILAVCLSRNKICDFTFSWLSIHYWSSYLIYIIGFPFLLSCWIEFWTRIFNFDDSFKYIAYIFMFVDIILLIWCRVSIENSTYIYGIKEVINREGLDEYHNIFLRFKSFIVIIVVLSTVIMLSGMKMNISIAKIITIIIYFLPHILLFVIFFQHLAHIWSLCIMEWGYRNINYYAHDYRNIFIYKFFDKFFEIFLFLYMMLTSLYWVVNFIFSKFNILDFNVKSISSFINIDLTGTEVRILIYLLFILAPFSLVTFIISSTVRSIKYSQIAKIQEEIDSKKDIKEIDTLLKLKENIENSSRLINIIDGITKTAVILFLTIIEIIITSKLKSF